MAHAHLGRDLVEGAVLEDTVFEEVGERESVLGLVVAARDRNVVVLRPGGTERFVLPVHPLHVPIILDRLVAVGNAVVVAAGPVIGRAELVGPRLGLQLHELVGREQIEGLGDLAVAGRTVVGHHGAPHLTGFGRHHHHAVGGARTVDGRRGSVLEHLDRLDVRVGEVVDIVHLETIDDVERRSVAVDRTDTAHLDVETGARSAVRGGDLHAGDLPSESLHHRTGLVAFDILRGHRSDRTRQVAAPHGAVTHDHHLVHDVRFGNEFDLQPGLGGDRHFLGFITQVRENQHVAFLDRNRERTLQVGRDTLRRTFDHDVGTDSRLIVLIDDLTRYLVLGRRCEGQHQGEKGQRPSQPESPVYHVFHRFHVQLG